MTVGAVLLHPDGRVLHTEGRALPSGHVGPDDGILPVAALRLLAEAGVDQAAVALVDPVPAHIDAHPVGGGGECWHYEVRFVFRVKVSEAGLEVGRGDGLMWLPAEDIGSPELRRRVLALT